MRPAVLVIDMIKDFVTGKYGSATARAIRKPIAKLLSQARKAKVPVVYCQDSHSPTDPELKVWGKHGIFGTDGAKTDSMLKPQEGEQVVPKHTFDPFFGTHLDDLLREANVETLILTGVATEICIQHAAASASFRRYKILVPKDGVAGMTPQAHEDGLLYMAKTYGAKITDISSLIRGFLKGKRGR